MNELQKRLWKRMIQLIQDYDHSRLSFNKLVDQLEGSLDTANLKDEKVLGRWYEFWVPLEEFEAEAAHELAVDYSSIRPSIESMRVFLKDQLKVWEEQSYLNTSHKLVHTHS